jgi:hypothetical protein
VALQESQRLAYLQELGIQSYFPRRVLPGARPSIRYSTESLGAEKMRISAQREAANNKASNLTASSRATLPQGSAAEASTQVSAATAQAGLEQTRALLHTEQRVAKDQKAVVEPKPAARTAPVEPAGAPVSVASSNSGVPEPISGKVVNFVFAYFAVSEDVAVVNELPWAGNAQVSAEHKALLAKILNAISVPCSPETLTPVVFRWPIEGMPDVLEGQGARNMLEGFMARRLKIKPARFLLVLAEQSSQYMFPADFSHVQSTEGFVSHPRLPCQVLVTRSLDAMTASRQVKSVVWTALQPLKHVLEQPASGPNAPT